MIWGVLVTPSVPVFMAGAAGALIAWWMNFDRFFQERARTAPVSTASTEPSLSAGPVMTRDEQRERRIPEGGREDVGDGVGYELAIVGESHYMAELRALGSRRSDSGLPLEFIATLLREPTNPYDANAIVVLSDRGKPIGYLSKEDALDYGPALVAIETQNKTAQCRAKLVGGTKEKRNIGVWLDIDPPGELLERLGVVGEEPF